MHEAVGAGRQRRRCWVKSPSLNAATQALGRRKRRSAAPAGPSVTTFAVLRAPGCARQVRCSPAGSWCSPAGHLHTLLSYRAMEALALAAPISSAAVRQTIAQHTHTHM